MPEWTPRRIASHASGRAAVSFIIRLMMGSAAMAVEMGRKIAIAPLPSAC
jgi:hypothetical protein